MNTAIKVIKKYYSQDTELYRILLDHSKAVTKKALEIAEKATHLSLDRKFIEEAAMLHDIGVFLTRAPEIGCFGESPYIRHGFLGREILEKEGLNKHALVCERHIGVGITAEEVKRRGLLLPEKDMIPVSAEEEVISLADKFFSKSSKNIFQEKKIEEIKEKLKVHGEDKIERFNYWLEKYRIKE